MGNYIVLRLENKTKAIWSVYLNGVIYDCKTLEEAKAALAGS